MTGIKAISIPEPCRQSWQQMSENTEGRHCNHCCKTVVDFTKMSDGEIIKYLSAKTNVCGRNEQYQLTHINNTLSAQKLKANWWKRALIVLSLLGPASLNTNAQSKPAIVNSNHSNRKVHKSDNKSKNTNPRFNANNLLEIRSSRYIPQKLSLDSGIVKPHQIEKEVTCSVSVGGIVAEPYISTTSQPQMLWIRVKRAFATRSELIYINYIAPSPNF
jgi:hypothetical protein